MNSILKISFIFSLIVMSACSSSKKKSDSTGFLGSDAAEEADERKSKPEADLAPGYLLGLASSQDQNLNGSFRVDINGYVKLPYNVRVQTTGLSMDEFRSKVEKAYASYFKGKAGIAISVKERRYYVEVRGLVSKPGEYLVRQTSPMDDLITQTGGLKDELSNGYVRIKQGSKTYWVHLADYFKYGKSDQVPTWEGGEQVFFQKEGPQGDDAFSGKSGTKAVQVYGEVRSIGDVGYVAGADIYYYLAKSGGPTTAADIGRVEVLRINEGKTRKSVFRGDLSDAPEIKDGDMVIVHSQKQKELDRVITLTSQVFSTVAVIGFLIIAL